MLTMMNPNTLTTGKLHRGLDAARVDDLARAMKHGFYGTVEVEPDGEGFRILNGHHRVAAAVRAGLLEIPCVVVQGVNDEGRAARFLADGLAKGLSPVDAALGLAHAGVDKPKASAGSFSRQVARAYDLLAGGHSPDAVRALSARLLCGPMKGCIAALMTKDTQAEPGTEASTASADTDNKKKARVKQQAASEPTQQAAPEPEKAITEYTVYGITFTVGPDTVTFDKAHFHDICRVLIDREDEDHARALEEIGADDMGYDSVENDSRMDGGE